MNARPPGPARGRASLLTTLGIGALALASGGAAPSAEPTEASFDLIFFHNRQGEIDPCG